MSTHFIPEPRYCLFCKKELIYRVNIGPKHWSKYKFCSPKHSTKWHSQNKVGQFSPEGLKKAKEKRAAHYTNEYREWQRQRMIGNTYAKGLVMTEEHKSKFIKSGKSHHKWKGDKASYSAFHKWLVKNYGKPYMCENNNCPKLSPFRFEYALLADKEHSHDRNNYRMLCVQCHRSYDSRKNKLNVQF